MNELVAGSWSLVAGSWQLVAGMPLTAWLLLVAAVGLGLTIELVAFFRHRRD